MATNITVTVDRGVQGAQGVQGVPGTFARPVSVGAIGDSITVACGAVDMYSNTQDNAWNQTARLHTSCSWLMFGAARSNQSWYPFEFNVGYSGARSDQILSTNVPTLLYNPYYGLPDMCVVLAGTNDCVQYVPTSTTITNIKAICSQLTAAGIIPIICSIPPMDSSITDNQRVLTQKLALATYRLAQELKLPYADFYSAMVSAQTGVAAMQSSTGSLSYTLATNNLHPSPLGASIMGYVLNQTIQNWCSVQGRLMPCTYDTASLNLGSSQYWLNNPGFTSITGTINTGGSMPSTFYDNNANKANNSFVYDSTGSEPGSYKTMYTRAPAIGGNTSTVNYVGNTWTLKGHASNSTYLIPWASTLSYNVGDKLAMRFRIKFIADLATNPVASYGVTVWDTPAIPGAYNPYRVFGIIGKHYEAGLPLNYQSTNIGNESGYSAGDVYLEYTAKKAGMNLKPYIEFMNTNATAVTNTNSSLSISNFQIVNLTQGSIVNP